MNSHPSAARPATPARASPGSAPGAAHATPPRWRALLPRLQGLANVLGAAALVWLAAPLWSLNGRHPFDGRAARLALLLAIALLLLLAAAGLRLLRRRRNAQLFAQLQSTAPASDPLTRRFSQAIELMRSGVAVRPGGGAAPWWQRRRQLYQQPWYLFIGAPGAGKTTALQHSGLRFPLAERLGAAPVSGVGGTLHCDWWFTEQAVFIDTAGRYTTQDSHADSDAREWWLFLQLLRRYRPVQPINGVIVTVSTPDLLEAGAELNHQALAVDRRLQELRRELGMSFPVYLLVTKVDLLAGFVEFFGDCDSSQREQPWGITFDLPPAGAPPLPNPLPEDLGARLAELPARIAALCPQRLQSEPQLLRRAPIYHFAAQVEALLPALEGFAQRAFRACATAPAQPVRGIHFSSGTQEGNPIDRVLGELRRRYGLALRGAVPLVEAGKAFFLTGLLHRLVIAEAPLAGQNLQRQRARRWRAAMLASGLAAAMLLANAAWIYSYRANRAYVAGVQDRVARVTQQLGPGPTQREPLLPLYALLNQLATSGPVDAGTGEVGSDSAAPWGLGFGLFQGPRLARSADQTYHRVLDQTFGPVVVDRLMTAVRNEADPAARYEALRVALMLVTPQRLQRGEVRRWAALSFATSRDMQAAIASASAASNPESAGAAGRSSVGSAAGRSASVGAGSATASASAPISSATTSAAGSRRPTPPGAAEQQEWLRHLDALLERNAVLGRLQLDPAALAAARSALATVPLAQRVHDRLLRRASARLEGPRTPVTLATLAGPAAVLAFAPVDAAADLPAIPVVATRQAWREVLEPSVDATIAEVADEADWVLGDKSAAHQRLIVDAGAREPVARQVGRLQAQAVIKQWDALLGSLALQTPADAEAVVRLATDLAAGDSPLRQLLRRLVEEFAPAPPGTGAVSAAGAAQDAMLAEHFGALRDYAQAALASAAGGDAIDRLVAPLPAVLQQPAGSRADALQRELRAEAAGAPQPFKGIWTTLADALAERQRQNAERELGGGIAELATACRRLTAERFPFSTAALRDLPHADFARLFGPRGLFDASFRGRVAAFVDTSQRPWRWRGEAPNAKAQAALRSFEMAEDIRRMFFAGNASLPHLGLQVTPAAMDPELLQFSIDVDGQLMRYENGPLRTKALAWPGPAATQRVVMRILPAGPNGIGAEVHEGPWALLRVLQRNGLQRGAGASAQARLEVDGRALRVEVKAEGPVPAALLAELGRFRCPEPW